MAAEPASIAKAATEILSLLFIDTTLERPAHIGAGHWTIRQSKSNPRAAACPSLIGQLALRQASRP